MRTLTYVPIIHSEADLGSLGESVKERFVSAFGGQQWDKRSASVELMWTGIRNKLLSIPFRWSSTRIYQDGLPVCDHELAIVKELAQKGSQNHALLVELMDRGAILMGTEDPKLLLREYQRILKLAELARSPVTEDVALAFKREGDELLRERDLYIAKRISTTLKDDERGILFIGLLHRVDELFGGDIRVQNLIQNLPLGAEPQRNLKPTEDDHEH